MEPGNFNFIKSFWQEGELWVQAGAMWLSALGWPSSIAGVVPVPYM
jgi:hypothetical protein